MRVMEKETVSYHYYFSGLGYAMRNCLPDCNLRYCLYYSTWIKYDCFWDVLYFQLDEMVIVVGHSNFPIISEVHQGDI